jgi:hypothetical protein
MKEQFRILCNIIGAVLVAAGAYHGWLGNFAQGSFYLLSALIVTIEY